MDGRPNAAVISVRALRAGLPRRAAIRGLLGLLAVAPVAAPLLAQSNDEIQTGTQFNFSTPGARSLALGGAFLGVADDATAAYTNPAGLTQLAQPEASLEARAWTFRSQFVERGHAPETALTGIGIDTVDGLAAGELADHTAGLSFVSYVHTAGRLALAVYRHQLADFAASLRSQGPFIGPRGAPVRTSPARSRLDLAIANFGLSAAWRLGSGLSVGLGASYFDFSLASHTDRFYRSERTGDFAADSLTGAFFGPADFRPDNVLNTQLQRGDDGDWAANLGVLWKIDGRWSVGGVFRQGPDFGFRATFIDGPASPNPGQVDPLVGGAGVFHVPDVVGLGVAWRPSEAVLLALDWDRVEYSDLSDDLVNLLRAGGGDVEAFRADDADEVHLGFEVQQLRWRLPCALRLGLWYDPDHKIRYTGGNENLRARFRAGEDELHAAAGLGLVVRRLQIDVAADLSDRVDTLSLSAVARF
jgi:long-subunit fatty acid transport protein